MREVDVRDLLEGASDGARAGQLDADDTWTRGRRRRTGKRVGAAVVTGVAGLAAAGLVWQTGFVGGSGEGEDLVAGFPEGTTTFVFAAPDAAGEVGPGTLPPRSAAGEDEVAGTTWELRGSLYAGGSAADVIGSASGTELVLPPDGSGWWGVTVEDCGGASVQGELVLDEAGRFPAGEVATDDLGCPAEVQAAEDFWMEALAAGGSMHLVGGDDYLLVSVPVSGTADDPVAVTEGPAVVTETTEPDQTDEPDQTVAASDPQDDAGPTGTATEQTGAEPTDEPAEESEGSGSPTDETDESSGGVAQDPPGEPADGGGGAGAGGEGDGGGEAADRWISPTDPAEGGEGLAAGAQLLAPTVRAGRHDGFDRVVVDLTGSGTPGWSAAYVDAAAEAGSGMPIEVAGDSLLRVRLSGMAMPEPGDPVYDGGIFGLDTHSLGAVVEVMRTTPFEGELQLLVGMDGDPRAYDVFVLEDPLRLVVDVRTAP